MKELKDMRVTHGKSKTKIYNIWRSIKARCYYKKDTRYNDYGGRGITMYEEWIYSFEKFYEYIGDSPGKRYSIDRINNDGNYEPNNIRWATDIEQSNNRRNNRYIEYNGIIKTLSQWAKEFAINPRTLYDRLSRGWDIERAFNCGIKQNIRLKTTEINQIDKNNGDILNTFKSLKEAELITKIKAKNISMTINGNSKTSGGYIWVKAGMVQQSRL